MAIDGSGMKMSDTERILSKENLTETMDWLEAALREKKASPKEIFTAQLLMEESFLQMAYMSKTPGSFSVKIALQGQLGSVSAMKEILKRGSSSP